MLFFQGRDFSFIFWSKWMLWLITAFKVLSCELLKPMSKGAPSLFRFSFSKQTYCRSMQFLSSPCHVLVWRSALLMWSVFTHVVFSSVSSRQPLLFRAPFHICYFFPSPLPYDLFGSVCLVAGQHDIWEICEYPLVKLGKRLGHGSISHDQFFNYYYYYYWLLYNVSSTAVFTV